MAEFDENGWRIWADYEPMPKEDWEEALEIMADCLPAIIERHEKENNA